MSNPKIGSLFSGYGGLDLAVQAVFGGEVAWVSDVDKGPNKILAHHHPDIPNLGDITTINWETIQPVDIICGGSPCQDLSLAGKRAGMKQGTRSGLWESMREAIAVIKPAIVVWENVKGALSAEATSDSDLEYDKGPLGNPTNGPVLRAIGRVLGDLADLGYDAGWETVRASDVGAPHRRERVFVLAWRRDAPAPFPSGSGVRGRSNQPNPRGTRGQDATPNRPDNQPSGPDTTSTLTLLPSPNVRDYKDSRIGPSKHRPDDYDLLARAIALVPDTDPPAQWGKFGPAIHRWENTLHREAPAPVQPTGRGGTLQLSAAFTEWMMGLPTGWITEVPGISRTQAIKACGNGVVPQQAAYALTKIINHATKDNQQ